MLPTLMPGDIAVALRIAPRPGRLVLARVNAKDIVKRVKDVHSELVYIVGDNRDESTDSRHYGAVDINTIKGVVILRIPLARFLH